MKGGYSDFYRQYSQWCDPIGYIPMVHDKNMLVPEFDPDMFVDRPSLGSLCGTSGKDRTRRFHTSIPSDSPFFQTSASMMDYSPVGIVADLARVFDCDACHDDSSSGGSTMAGSRGRTVYINTDDDGSAGTFDDDQEDGDRHGPEDEEEDNVFIKPRLIPEEEFDDPMATSLFFHLPTQTTK
jgi:hypothetical protein